MWSGCTSISYSFFLFLGLPLHPNNPSLFTDFLFIDFFLPPPSCCPFVCDRTLIQLVSSNKNMPFKRRPCFVHLKILHAPGQGLVRFRKQNLTAGLGRSVFRDEVARFVHPTILPQSASLMPGSDYTKSAC